MRLSGRSGDNFKDILVTLCNGAESELMGVGLGYKENQVLEFSPKVRIIRVRTWNFSHFTGVELLDDYKLKISRAYSRDMGDWKEYTL